MIPGRDPTLLAWVITAAYFAGAILTLLAAQASNARRDRIFWLGCTGLLLLLGFNKQLDLQRYITIAGRALAHQEGWFEERRLVQGAFILALSMLVAAVLAALAIWLRRSTGTVKLAATGIVLLLAFILLRAASFHHVDYLVTRNIAGMRSGWWLELAGIVVIGISATVFRRGNRAPSAQL